MTFQSSTLPAARSFHGPVVACLFLLFGGASARGAVYEFTLTGNVTAAPAGDVKVGDPFTVRYAVDAQDLAPDSTDGLYTASGATIDFPELRLATADVGEFFVRPGTSTAPDLLHYLTYDPSAWGVTINFQFHNGTYVVDKILDSGYLAIGKQKLAFDRQE